MLDDMRTSEPSNIEARLLLGNAASAANLSVLRRHRVTHVVNATANLPNHFESMEGAGAPSYLRVPVDDSLEADLLKHLDAAVAWIADALSDPFATGKVLVHCQQGVSRSATLVIAFLMRERGLSLEAARARVHERRWTRPNEAFLSQLKKYERAGLGVS